MNVINGGLNLFAEACLPQHRRASPARSVALLYGVAHMAIAIADLLGTGFDRAGDLIRLGTLDRPLLRPRTTVLQLLGYEFALRRLGRFPQGALIFAWARGNVEVAWTLPSALLVFVTVLSGACLFLGLFTLQGTLSIWTVQTLEIVSATTYGGVQAAQYPLSIYEGWFRRFFTYLIPLAAATSRSSPPSESPIRWVFPPGSAL